MGTSAALGPVVVGVSGSPDSDRAVDWAADYAASTNRRLLAVHGTGFVGVRPNAQDLLQAERVALEAGQMIVDAAVERAQKNHPGLEASGVVDIGEPTSILFEEGRHAALLVVGSRRSEAFKRLFGSVSLGVTRHATCPLVVVRPPSHRTPGTLIEHVVLGLDGGAESREAARFAFEYASLTGLPLVIVHGSWERLSRGSSVLGLLTEAEERGVTAEEELSIAETIAGLPQEFPDVEHRDVHRSTDPAEALIEASETAKLVVVGTRELRGPRALLLRSVSTALVEHAHCPVAVVRARGVHPVE
ncbi:MAG: universal stress protein [Actinomycetota bacterium]